MSELAADLGLFPRPTRCRAVGGEARIPERPTIAGVPDAWTPDGFARVDAHDAWAIVSLRPDADPPGGYRLRLAADAARLEAGDESGVRAGLVTLARLAKRRRRPGLEIVDRPAFPVRGVMLDVSRDRAPTMDHLQAIVDQLAAWKINHLQLYTEHMFAYTGHEIVWRGGDPFTPDEIRTLDAYCAQRGVELAANQNCFGHLHRWFRHEPYRDLAETLGDWDFDGTPRAGGFSICPIDDRSAPFIESLLDQLMPCFTSPRINIGCDETFDVGQGRSREVVAEQGRASVYASFVNGIAQAVNQRGGRPMFWADIALRDPRGLDELDRSLLALAWGYEPDSPFDQWRDALPAAGFDFWVCPGTSTWRSITGRTTERRGNLRAATSHGVAGGATGCLVTNWGDLGHRQQWPIELYALAEGASAAWSGPDGVDETLSPTLADEAFGAPALGPWLDELGDLDRELRVRTGLKNATEVFTDYHRPWGEDQERGDAAEWRGMRDRLEDLATCRPTVDDDQIARELEHTIEAARIAIDRAVARRTGVGRTARAALAGRIDDLIASHRECWLARCRPGGLDDSCGHDEAVAVALRSG